MADKDDKADKLARAKKLFARAEEAEQDNRDNGLEVLRFARLGEQWPDEIRAARQRDGRPCLTINKLPAFIRQVVNDARQNKPSIKVHPVDSGADPETAKVLGDLIRNIESTSNADIAYDTAVERACDYHVGYIRIGIDYESDDSFDPEIRIDRVANPVSVYGDPDATSADGSDWNNAFVVDVMSKEKFEANWGDKAQADWDNSAWTNVAAPWKTEDTVMVAEWWERVPTTTELLRLSTGMVVSADRLMEDEDLAEVRMLVEAGAIAVEATRPAKSYKVLQHFMTGAEILETRDWPGKFIPIVPVYGEEINVAGERVLRSMVHDAIDPQRMFNYWRTTATELVALAPRVPYIGAKGAFDADKNKWRTLNTQSHAYVEYDAQKSPAGPPQRQPLDSGTAVGALQEALNASDDMKAILGIYDASLGARSNETSGRAIMARQREGDISTFHIIDNLARAIRHTGKVVLDLIPHVYSGRKMLRVVGEDGKASTVPMGQPVPVMGADGEPKKDDMGQVVTAIHDVSVGRYDVTISAGPSFTTRREEAAFQMTEAIRAVPAFAPLMLDKLAKVSDWPEAEDIAERAKQMMPGQQLPPEVQQALQEGQQAAMELQQLQADKTLEAAKLEIEKYKAATDRMKVRADIGKTAAEIEVMDRPPEPAKKRA